MTATARAILAATEPRLLISGNEFHSLVTRTASDFHKVNALTGAADHERHELQ